MRNGFTLAEVLLVLSVIGIVAALTIPTLIQKVSKDQYVSKLKKEYSTLSQAFLLLQTENGGTLTGNIFTAGKTHVDLINALATKINIIKNCGTGTGCWYSSSTYQLNGNIFEANADTTSTGGRAVLADGTLLYTYNYANDCTSDWGTGPIDGKACTFVSLDLNGVSGPNTLGRDIFRFYITQTGVYPYGTYDSSVCDSSSNGTGCSGKVLSEGTMNY